MGFREWWGNLLHPSAVAEPVVDKPVPVLGSFSQGSPLPAFLPRRTYGDLGTIHQTGTIDIQVNWEQRKVTGVWFRCLNLPFTVNADDLEPVNRSDIAIEEITYVELPDET
jgi:hypothetical protein